MDTRTLTQTELADEAKARFGDNPLDWAFECPSCHDVATGHDFAKALAEHPTTHGEKQQPVTATDIIGQHCIGRNLGALNNPPTHTRGCSHAAYGLISGPWTIAMPDGVHVPAFPLAPAPEGE